MDTKGSIKKSAIQLSDDELDAVAGGEDYECYPCPKCGKWFAGYPEKCPHCHTYFCCLKCGAYFGYIGDVSECPHCHRKLGYL